MMQAKKRRFNTVDFLLIMICLAAVLALVLQGNLARTIGLEDVGSPTEYTLLIPSLSSDEVLLFRAGNSLTHFATGELLGTVSAVRRENAPLYKLVADGQVQKFSDSSLFDLTLTISGTGKDSERGFLLNGTIYAAAGDLLPITPDGTSKFNAMVIPTPKQG